MLIYLIIQSKVIIMGIKNQKLIILIPVKRKEIIYAHIKNF